MDMARPKLNRTPEELAEMNRQRRNRYYESHKEEESSKNLARYHSKKVLSGGDMPLTGSFGGDNKLEDGYGAYDR